MTLTPNVCGSGVGGGTASLDSQLPPPEGLLMTDEERAARYVALFNHYDASGNHDLWRSNVPCDAEVSGDTVYLSRKKLTRVEPGCWMVSDGV